MMLKSGAVHKLAIPLLIACLVGVCYSSVVMNRYGFYDDYVFLDTSSNSFDLFSLVGPFSLQGRPLNGLFVNIGYSWANYSISKLSILRSVGLFGVWCAGLGLYYFCRAHRLTTVTSLALSCSIILLPSFQVYASWAILFAVPFAALFALAAAFLLTPPCSTLEGNQAGKITLSAALLLTALLIYQPTAMFFCTGIALSLIASVSAGTPWEFRRFSATAISLGAALGLGLLVQRASLIYSSITPSGVRGDRIALAHDIAKKLGWFVSELLPNAFSLFFVPGSLVATGAVLALIVTGAVLYCRRHGRPAWLALTGAACCMIIAAAPNLATAENWATYRSIVAVGAVIAVLAVLMAREIGIWAASFIVMERVRKLAGKGLLLFPVALVALAGWSAHNNVSNGFVAPNVALLESLEELIKTKVRDSGKPSRVVIWLLQEPPPASLVSAEASSLQVAHHWVKSSFVFAYDEFGFFTSRIAAPTESLVRLALRNAGVSMNEADAPSVVIEKELSAGGPHGQNDLLLDFRWISLCGNKHTRDVFYPIDLIDGSWVNGIWKSNQFPRGGFIYTSRHNCSNSQMQTGDVLRFKESGLRRVIKVDDVSLRPFVGVLVDGMPLSVKDGYPNFVIRESR